MPERFINNKGYLLMTTENRFSDVISSEAELRKILGEPSDFVKRMKQPAFDEFSRRFIEQSPFLLLSTSDAQGNLDVSPKGDPAGFVTILDDNTLLIPDRVGNRRADTLTNILKSPNVALLFLIPGKRDTLRVTGTARIIRDADLREKMAIKGKAPQFIIAVTAEEVFFHCQKCILRSNLWDAEAEPETVSTIVEAALHYNELDEPAEEFQKMMDAEDKEHLY